MPTGADIRRFRVNWQDEIDSVSLYNALADLEEDPKLADVYRRLAATEERHAQFWEQKIREAGHAVPTRHVGWRSRVLAWLAARFGVQMVLPTITAMERFGNAGYLEQPETAHTEMPGQERSHARLLVSLARGKGLSGPAVAQLEGRHRTGGGNALRAAVLGANDGLLSNLNLVMGVAGATASQHTIVITGLAGLLAGASSMALGEWVSVQSSRELYERQIAIEKQELEEQPEEEKTELALIYEAKGLPREQARALAERLMANKETALDTLAREELGIDPDELGGSPWTAGITSFFLFAIGAILPVLPFFFLAGTPAMVVAMIVAGIALFLIGAGITLLTGRGVLYAGLRQVLFGLVTAGIIFGIGRGLALLTGQMLTT
ncbi:MAG TPA: VIT1/CCC1 transporter family protein [Oscillatoriaceae cyanobacterium]